MADAKKETKTVAKAPAAEQKKEETTGVTRRLAKTSAANNASVAAVAEKEGTKAAEKKTATKKTATKKTATKKTAEKKTVAKTETTTAAKKTAEKKTTAKKETAVKDSGVTANVVLQHYGKDTNINEIIENVKKSYVADGHKSTSIKSLNVYLKPEDGFAYFVINESYAGKVDLF